MMASDVPTRATGVLRIDLGQIAGNWKALNALVGPAQCGAVVKANAYGLGSDRVIPALAKAGCRTFFIATPDEGTDARALVPDAEIYALDGLMPDAGAAFLRANVQPVLSSAAECEEWASLARTLGKRLPAALHVDSGLNRLGLSAQDVDWLSRNPSLLEALRVTLIMSHLACADDPADPKNVEQRRTFESLRLRLPRAPASLAASDGLMLGSSYHFDLVRPGYALYGGQAFKGGGAPVKPALEAAARVLQVRDVAAGETVGYAASWKAERPSRIAIVAAGYADGVPRTASAATRETGGAMILHGQRLAIAGRVSMDLITLDVTDCKTPVKRGDLATYVGGALSLEDAGTNAKTIGYEVLTSLSRRFHRVYING